MAQGELSVRQLPEYRNPEADHILDWFHLTMRITVPQQCARGLPAPKFDTPGLDTTHRKSLERRLESVKHYLWHGYSTSALAHIGDVDDELEGWDYDDDGEKHLQPGSAAAGRMLKYVREMATYIAKCGINRQLW